MSETVIAIIIGIVEGLTEFLPISSTGHMIIVGSLLGFEGEKASVFQVFIQLGAILSVFILYRDTFLNLFKPRSARNCFSIWHIAAGILPVLAVGFFISRNN